jgi:phosphatidylglycerol:prolipoprotein diacylglycerol transferase
MIGKRHADGAIIATYLILYGIVRFMVEFYRFHEQGNLWGTPLDTSQWISLALFLAGTVYLVRVRRTPQTGV